MIAEVVLSAALTAGLTVQAPAQAPASSAQASPAPASLEQEFLKNFFRDQKAIWTSPYHVRPADAKWLIPLAVGTATFIFTDRRVGDEVAELPPVWLHAGNAISYAGSGYAVCAGAATFYVVGRVTDDARARETGLLATEAFLDSALVGSVIKVITQRARPDAGLTRGDFFTSGSSFPSGHALTIWSFASVVAHEYSDHRWVQIAAYGTAAAVSVARVAAQRHYLSDVLVGSSLGYAIGRYVFFTHRRLDQAGADSPPAGGLGTWPSIAAHYNRGTREYGVTLAWTVR